MDEEKRFLKFLTREIAEFAVMKIVPLIREMKSSLNRQVCHIIVLVPAKKETHTDLCGYPYYEIEPRVLFEYSLGDPETWPRKFNEIAFSKALQLWQGRNDDRTDCMPHLLFPGDTPFWGGVRRYGFVVACSGFQPRYDQMFAGLIAEICAAMAYDAWMTSPERTDIIEHFKSSLLS